MTVKDRMDGGAAGSGEGGERQIDPSVETARRILAMRRLRDRLLGDFFAEPSWDILLDLYVQTHEGKIVTVSQLSLATGAPPTTALRWINTMAEAGLLARRQDAADGRRVIVSLSDRGEEAMRLLLASVLSAIETPFDGADRVARKPTRARSLRARCETSPSSSTPSSTRDPETAS
jgi:DNA-binding MarR family transcriptional regulator